MRGRRRHCTVNVALTGQGLLPCTECTVRTGLLAAAQTFFRVVWCYARKNKKSISFPFRNSDLPAFTPRVCTVYCCPCCVSVICLLHVSVYVGIDRRALILNSFEEKRVLASYIILLL